VILAITAGLLVGFVIVLLGAPLAQQTTYNTTIANRYLATAMQTLDRPSFIVSPTTDISFESRAVNEQFSREEIPGDPSMLLEITRNSRVRCGQRACTFIDSKFGVSFDLRDIAVFQKLTSLQQNGALKERVYNTTETGQNKAGVGAATTFVRAVARVDDGGSSALDMDLDRHVRHWIEGREDATGWHRIWKGVERMFAMRGSALSWLKSLVPVIALIGGLFAAYYLFGPGSLPGAPSSREIGIGAGFLPLLGQFFGDDVESESESDGSDEEPEPDPRVNIDIDNSQLKQVAAVLVGCSTLIALALTAPGIVDTLLIAAVSAVVSAGGLWVISTSIISAFPRVIRDSIGNLWLTLALKALEDPIIYQTKDGELELREADAVGVDGSGPRYRIGNTLVGFAVSRAVDSFDDSGLKGSKLGQLRSTQQQVDAVADGGVPTVVDTEFEVTDEVQNGSGYGIVPTHDSMDAETRGATYVRTDKWMSRMTGAATGSIAKRAQQEATKEFADGDNGYSDETLMYLSLGAALLGLALGAVVWSFL
jgi:hypothetical protein